MQTKFTQLQDHIPKIDVQFGQIEVKITGTEQREEVQENKGWLASWTGLCTYTVYRIEVTSQFESDKDLAIPFTRGKSVTFRRFKEFEKLLVYLRDQENLRGILIPELP